MQECVVLDLILSQSTTTAAIQTHLQAADALEILYCFVL